MTTETREERKSRIQTMSHWALVEWVLDLLEEVYRLRKTQAIAETGD